MDVGFENQLGRNNRLLDLTDNWSDLNEQEGIKNLISCFIS